MRALRLSLAGTVILALLGGLGGAVMAQDEEEAPVTATYVTGEAGSGRVVSQPSGSEVDGVWEDRDLVGEHDVEWSDPRLPALLQLRENQDWHGLADGDEAVTFVTTVRLEDPEGAWTGVEYGIAHGTIEGISVKPRMMLLTGEGAYAGLSAMLQRTYLPGDTMFSRPVFEGFIFAHGLTPMPDPVEPAAG